MTEPKESILPYRVEEFKKAWKVTDTENRKAVIQNVSCGTAKQYERLLNEAFQKGFAKGVELNVEEKRSRN